MAKKKKNTGQIAKSEPTLIKERARKLPIYKCYINSDWEETGIASVFVSRNHVNGNVTVGVYQVDLYLKGVKDAFARFNLTEHTFNEEMIGAVEDLIEVDYDIAHNIIYGSIEFAEDNGFYPHKEWKYAQYVLDEDNEEIPLINISFGKNGKPILFGWDHGWENDMAVLDKTVGKGNYDFIAKVSGEHKEEDDTILSILNSDLRKYMDEKYLIEEDGFESFLDGDEGEEKEFAMMAYINMAYYNFEGKKHYEGNDVITHAIGDIDIENELKEKEKEEAKKISKDNVNKFGGEFIINELRNNPDSDYLFFNYFLYRYIAEEKTEEDVLLEAQELQKEFPESLAAKTNLLIWLAIFEEESAFLKAIKEFSYSRDMFNPQNDIGNTEFVLFCIVKSYENIFLDKLKEADMYYMAVRIFMAIEELPYIEFLSMKLADMKLKFIEEKKLLEQGNI